jgi:hypothetical protein
MPLRLPGIARHRRAIRPRVMRRKATHPRATRRVMRLLRSARCRCPQACHLQAGFGDRWATCSISPTRSAAPIRPGRHDPERFWRDKTELAGRIAALAVDAESRFWASAPAGNR